MSKVVFFGFPAHGHTNPTLAVVKELVNRGEQVIYYSFDEFKDKIEQTGAAFKSYNIDLSKYTKTTTGHLPKLYRLMMEVGYLLLHQIYDDVTREKPDYIIHDSFACWGKYAAASLHIPAVSSVTIFAANKKSTRFSKQALVTLFHIIVLGSKDMLKGMAFQSRIAREFHIPKNGFIDAFMNKEDLNIVYTSKNFQPNGDSFDSSFLFVGPSISPRKESCEVLLPESISLPVVYISLGTLVNQNLEFYTMCFEALGNEKLQVVMSVGNKTDLSSLLDVPANFIVRNYVSQLEVLSKSNCFITHGGMNSVHEGLYYGVPLIVVPQTQEQSDVAERVDATKAGISLRKVNPQLIKDAVMEVLRNSTYKTIAQQIGESFKEAGGYVKAADEILRYARQTACKS